MPGTRQTDRDEVSDRRLGRVLGILGVALELPLIGQIFFFDDVFDWGWLFLLALLGPTFALAGLALSAERRDWIGVGVASFGLGGIVVPVMLVLAIVTAFQQG
jgi:hypothetical protein